MSEAIYSKQLELKKHVALIHSHSKISLLQRKIANALLFHAYDNLLSKEEHSIQISELTKLIGYDSHDHRKIKDSLIELLATVIEWNIVDGEKIDKEGIWNASSIISDASIQGSVCTYSYSNKMRKLLYHPSIYGRLNLTIQSKFQSSYGLALYENCNRYQDIGQTPAFEIEKFRKLMGVEDDKYKIFRDFKTRVINKAVEEVNKYSGFKIEPNYKKLNRQVVSLQFTIKKVSITTASEFAIKNQNDELQNRLKSQFGLSNKQIQEILKLYEIDYILEKIKIVLSSSSYLKGQIKNIGKYLLSAIKDDYQDVKGSKNIEEKVKQKKEKSKIDYEKYIYKTVLDKLNSISEESKKEIIKKFDVYMSKNIFQKLYQDDGFDNVLVEEQLVKFILGYGNAISSQILKYEDWASK